MKQVFLFIAACCLVSSSLAQYGSGLKSLELKGKVKSLKSVETYRYKKAGVFTEWGKLHSRTYDFDKTGNTVEFQEFNKDGALSYKMQYAYKPKEKKIEIIYLDKELKPYNKNVWLLDNKGQRIEEIKHTKEGIPDWRYTYKYNEQGNSMEDRAFKPDGSLYSTTTWTFDSKGFASGYLLVTTGYANSSRKYINDDNGNKIEETWHDGKGAMDFRFIRTYDDRGNKIKEIKYRFENTKPLDTVTWKYEYDKAGNWTKRTQYTNDGVDFHIEERMIVYY